MTTFSSVLIVWKHEDAYTSPEPPFMPEVIPIRAETARTAFYELVALEMPYGPEATERFCWEVHGHPAAGLSPLSLDLLETGHAASFDEAKAKAEAALHEILKQKSGPSGIP